MDRDTDPDGAITILRLAKVGEVFESMTLAVSSDTERVFSVGRRDGTIERK